ncbi:MAG: hypothetical protein HOV96_19380 [Nonomuraea sp.]|nr:hypothetical protein [Nonomuraea sp.]
MTQPTADEHQPTTATATNDDGGPLASVSTLHGADDRSGVEQEAEQLAGDAAPADAEPATEAVDAVREELPDQAAADAAAEDPPTTPVVEVRQRRPAAAPSSARASAGDSRRRAERPVSDNPLADAFRRTVDSEMRRYAAVVMKIAERETALSIVLGVARSNGLTGEEITELAVSAGLDVDQLPEELAKHLRGR